MILFLFRKKRLTGQLLSLALLTAAVWKQAYRLNLTFGSEQLITVGLLFLCLLGVDLSINRNGWVKNSSYHLVLFPLLVAALPWEIWNNWLLVFSLFFWSSFLQVVTLNQGEHFEKKVFNAGFLYCFGALFVPNALLCYPLLLVFLALKNHLSFKVFFLLLVSVVSLVLLDVIVHFWRPAYFLFPPLETLNLTMRLPIENGIKPNLWWGLIFLMLLFSIVRHSQDKPSKNAAYGAGLNTLFFSVVFAFLYGIFIDNNSGFSWVLMAMCTSTLFPRTLERISSPWLREALFGVFVLCVFYASIRV